MSRSNAKMTTKGKYWAFLLALFTICLFFLFLSVAWSQLFVVGAMVVMVFVGIGLMSLQCPRCGAALLFRKEKFLGISIATWWPTLPKHCHECECEID